jgi:hypothetical protein
MEIKKEITVNPTAEGRCFAGIYKGINKRGAVMFEGVIADNKVLFNVMPRSIKAIYKAEINVEDEENESI